MAPLLPSLFLRVAAVGGVEEKHRAHLKDRQPIALVWKDEHSSKIKRLLVLMDDLSSLEYDISNVASGAQAQVAPEFSPGPSDVPFLAVAARVHLVVGLVAVLLKPVLNPNSPSSKKAPSAAGGQIMLYDLLARRKQTRALSLRDCPHSTVTLDSVPQDIRLNCSGDLLLACIDRDIVLFRVAVPPPPAQGTSSSWWTSSTKQQQHRQLSQVQVIKSDFIGAVFCSKLPNRILGLCHPLPSSRSEGMRAVRLDLQDGSDAPPIRGHDAGLGELPGRVTAWSWDSQGDAVALGTADGIMALHRCSHPNKTKKSVAPEGRLVESMAWHPHGAVLIVGLEGAMLAVLDAALQPLLVVADGSLSLGAVPGPASGAPAAVVDVASALGMQTQTAVLASPQKPGLHRSQVLPLAEWGRPVMEPFFQGSGTPLYEMAALAVPGSHRDLQPFAVGVCQVAVGGLSGGRLRGQELVAQHLSDGEPMRALNLVEAAGDPQAQYHGLQLLLDRLLRGDLGGPHAAAIMEILDEVASEDVVWGQVERLQPPERQAELRQVMRRYVAKLLDLGWVEPAFKVAKAIHCRAAVEDIYVAAVHLNDSALVQAIWDTLQQLEEGHGASLASPQHLEAMRRLQVNEAREDSRADDDDAFDAADDAEFEGAALELEGRIQEAMEVYEAAGAEPQLEALQGLVDASMPQPAEREEEEEELEEEDLEDDIDAPLDLPMDGPESGGRTGYSQNRP